MTERPPHFTFPMLGLSEGDHIESVETGETAEVVGERTVRFRGSETSITSATRWVRGIKASRSLRHWRYRGRSLSALYNQAHPP
mgnify:CR=1 FL=1